MHSCHPLGSSWAPAFIQLLSVAISNICLGNCSYYNTLGCRLLVLGPWVVALECELGKPTCQYSLSLHYDNQKYMENQNLNGGDNASKK